MNKEMWAHPATQRNMAQLRQDGAIVLGVGQGDQACGEVGDGRMLEPDELLYELTALFQPKVLQGKKILISAGPTYEAMDPVRGITNLSSGKMGFALARAAHEGGASVQLVAGPVSLPTPYGVARTDVRSALEMHAAVMAQVERADIFIATAAVADWRPAQVAAEKIKKGSEGLPSFEWVENPDILADVAAHPRSQAGDLYCVGFAAETQYLQAQAQAKRERKGVPLMIGNLGPATFGQDDNALLVIDEQGVKELPRAAKLILARQLVADIALRISSKTKGQV
jgi:phosphopantothenoylcysteine decarboxylase/phosphopantothenate--cysteine ligase